LIVKIRAHVANVRIGKTDNLAHVAGVGENFLVAGEAGIKNDFAAAARRSSRGAPVKKPPVLKREDSGPKGYFRQRFLREYS